MKLAFSGLRREDKYEVVKSHVKEMINANVGAGSWMRRPEDGIRGRASCGGAAGRKASPYIIHHLLSRLILVSHLDGVNPFV